MNLAARLPRAGWSDPRLWLGLGLLVVSTALGIWILASPSDTIAVWRAARDLPAGSVPVLERVEIDRAVAQDVYLPASQTAQGVLMTALRSGELVPRSAIAVVQSVPSRHVSVPVESASLPIGLQAGDLVDIWSAGEEQSTHLVLAKARIAGEPVEAGFGGEQAVELIVPEADVGSVVDAVSHGPVMLVGVPIDTQQEST